MNVRYKYPFNENPLFLDSMLKARKKLNMNVVVLKKILTIMYYLGGEAVILVLSNDLGVVISYYI